MTHVRCPSILFYIVSLSRRAREYLFKAHSAKLTVLHILAKGVEQTL